MWDGICVDATDEDRAEVGSNGKDEAVHTGDVPVVVIAEWTRLRREREGRLRAEKRRRVAETLGLVGGVDDDDDEYAPTVKRARKYYS